MNRPPAAEMARVAGTANEIGVGRLSSELESGIFRHVVDMLPDTPVLVHDIADWARLKFVNDAACRHFGMAREALLRATLFDLDPDFTKAAMVSIYLWVERNRTATFETRHRTASGEMVPVSVQVKLIRHEGRLFSISLVRRLAETDRARLQLDSLRYLSSFEASLPGFLFSCRLSDGRLSVPYVSPAIHEFYGTAPTQDRSPADSKIPDLELADLLPEGVYPADKSALLEAFHRSAASGEIVEADYRFLHPDKGECWMHLRASPHDQNDGSVMWHGFIYDNTGHKRMEETLRKREREFHSLAENTPDNIARWDAEGRLIYCNPAHQRSVGKAAAELIGKTNREAFPDGRYTPLDEAIARILGREEGAQFVRQPVPCDNGEQQFHEVKLTPEFDENGRLISVLGLGRDMTDVYRMQDAIAQREQKFRALAESSPDNIIRYDLDDRIRYINANLIRMLRLGSAEEVLGKRPREAWPDGRFAAIEAASAQARATGAPQRVELQVPVGAGKTEYHQLLVVVERDTAGTIVGTLLFGRDVTAMRETELRLRHFINSLPGLAYTYRLAPDGQSSFPYVCDAIEDVFGLRPEEVTEKFELLHHCWHPEDGAKLLAAVAETSRTMNPLRVEARACRPERPERWFDVRSVPERQPDGGILWYGLMLDITERKRMEESLRKREREYHSLAENTPDNIARWGTDGRILYSNPTHQRTLDKPVAEMIGKTHRELFPDGRYDVVDDAIARIAATGKTVEFVRAPEIRADGEIRMHDVKLAPEFDEGGRVVSVLGLGRDMTDIYRMQEAVAQREQEFRSLAESFPDNIIRVDREHRIRYLNTAMARSMKLDDADELIGKRHDEVFPDQRFLRIYVAEKRAMTSGEKQVIEVSVPRDDGSHAFHLLSVVPERDAAGKVIGAIVVGRDITERKQAEDELQRRYDNILDLNKRLNLAEAMYRGILRSAPDGMMVVDEHGIITMVNAELTRLFGYNESELIGQPVEMLVPPDVRERHIAYRDTIVSRDNVNARPQEVVAAGLRACRKNGGEFKADITLSRLPAEEGLPGIVCASIRDITQRMRMEEELRRTVAFQKLLLDGLRDVGIWQLVIEGGKVIYHNDTHFGAVLGYSADDLPSPPDYIDLVHPDDRARIIERYQQRMAGNTAPDSYEMGVLAKDGSRREFLMYSCVVPDSNPPRTLTLSMDLTERKRMEDQLRQREQEFRSLAENTPDTIARHDRECRRIYVNPTLLAAHGLSAEQLLGTTPAQIPGGESGLDFERKMREVLTSRKAADYELVWRDPTGKVRSALLGMIPEVNRDGKITGVLAVGRDITQLIEYREQIHKLAFYDLVTKLANRALFGDRLNQAIAEARWHDTLLGVMLLDLDRFKAVNDTLGHHVGDALLREAAERLSRSVRDYDTVARLGGDEFVVLLPEIRDGQSLSSLAEKIIAALAEPFQLEGKEVFVGASIGIALYPNDSDDVDGLLKSADLAMYAAKNAGGNGYCYYAAELTSLAQERMRLETELRRALERNELELYFQPKVALLDTRMIGSEALLRWNSSRFGMVPPDRFIGIAEDTGMIVKIGAWVLHEACRAASAWNGAGKPLHKVAVNLSPRQFAEGNLVSTVALALCETACRPEWIELEITESLLLGDADEARGMLESFRDMGFSIAIDDFGTGYSALSYLMNFPIDVLKIDRSFVKDVLSNPSKAELVKAIIAMVGSLKMGMVAEGGGDRGTGEIPAGKRLFHRTGLPVWQTHAETPVGDVLRAHGRAPISGVHCENLPFLMKNSG